MFAVGFLVGCVVVAAVFIPLFALAHEEFYREGWDDAFRRGKEHLNERAEVTLSLAPAGGLNYANLRSLVFRQAAGDLEEIRSSL